MSRLLIVLSLAGALGCGSQDVARDMSGPAAAEPREAAQPAAPGPQTQAVPSRGGSPEPGATREPPPPADTRHVGTYRLRLSEEQRRQIQAGLEEVRAQARKGDMEAAQALPALESAAERAESATMRLSADGTYVASVDGSEAKGRYRVVGDEVRFDAPADGRPAAYPTMRLDAARTELVAETGGERVRFVKGA